MFDTDAFKQSIGIPYYENMTCDTFGLDSLEHCFNKQLFKEYKDKITYQFNELGYRDRSIHEYRGDEILAIGDSFTVGLGVNVEDCWFKQIEKITGYTVLNFSLNGASNDWISRKTQSLLNYFTPRYVFIHYTFSHRRERPNTDWHDNERTECEAWYSDEDNLRNWEENFNKIKTLCSGIPVVHSGITNWHTSPHPLLTVDKVDLARDGFHYGPKTHRLLATTLLAHV